MVKFLVEIYALDIWDAEDEEHAEEIARAYAKGISIVDLRVQKLPTEGETK